MRLRCTTLILAAAVGLAAVSPASSPAARVRVSSADPPERGAVGEVVLGRGGKLSGLVGREALAELPAPRCPCEITIYLRLPTRSEATRYPIRIVGGGYEGLLVSDRTRIPGLVSIFDVAPTVRALERGEKPPVSSRADPRPQETLRELDERLAELPDARSWANWVVAGLVAAFALAAAAFRSRLFGRAALLSAPIALATVLGLSALELGRARTVSLALLAAVGVGAPLLAAVTRPRRAFGAALSAIFVVYLIVLWAFPETNSLAAIGPHPEEGGRFYGLTNQVETMLLVPAIAGAALLGPVASVPAMLLALTVVGAGRLGADGGGVVVFAAGYVVLWLRLRRTPLTARTGVLVALCAIAVGLALVGLDAALGGSSHVSRAIGDGPVSLAGDLAHRWHVSAHRLTSSLDAVLLIVPAVAVLVWLGLRRPRAATVDATLAAIAVSLLVNDSPRDVLAWGALSCAALRLWKDARRVQ